MTIPPMSVRTVDGASGKHMILISVTLFVMSWSPGFVTILLLLLVVLTACLIVMDLVLLGQIPIAAIQGKDF